MPGKSLRVLWIEDKTQLELAYLVPPVLLDGRYDLEVARDATEMVNYLSNSPRGKFDLLIFDLDLPPGDWNEFVIFYKEFEKQGKEPAMLGLELLSFVRTGQGTRRGQQYWHSLEKKPLGTLLQKIHQEYSKVPAGVFSIYTYRARSQLIKLLGLEEQSKEVQNQILIQKHAGLPRTTLLRLLRFLEKFYFSKNQ